MKTIGNKIKELRRTKGLSQKDIADQLGITSQAVSKWENDTSLPDMSMLPDLAALFGIQIDDLFEYSAEKRYAGIGRKIEYQRTLTNKEFEGDEAFLLREIESNPEKYEALSLLGDLYSHQAECLKKKSVYYARRALELRPNTKGDINNINHGCHGKLYDWSTGSHDELIDLWKKLLKDEPKNLRIYFYLLDNLIDDGRFGEAKEVLKQSKRHNPDDLNAYYDIFIREKEEGFAAVKEKYEELAKAHSENWRILFSIANSFSFHEYYEEAIGYWQKTFDCMPKPRYTDPYLAMAQCCLRMGDKKAAAEYYKLQLELLREDWGVKYGEEVERVREKIRELE